MPPVYNQLVVYFDLEKNLKTTRILYICKLVHNYQGLVGRFCPSP
jgi:hypothetical protein